MRRAERYTLLLLRTVFFPSMEIYLLATVSTLLLGCELLRDAAVTWSSDDE